jgi:hypothetical protein
MLTGKHYISRIPKALQIVLILLVGFPPFSQIICVTKSQTEQIAGICIAIVPCNLPRLIPVSVILLDMLGTTARQLLTYSSGLPL